MAVLIILQIGRATFAYNHDNMNIDNAGTLAKMSTSGMNAGLDNSTADVSVCHLKNVLCLRSLPLWVRRHPTCQ